MGGGERLRERVTEGGGTEGENEGGGKGEGGGGEERD